MKKVSIGFTVFLLIIFFVNQPPLVSMAGQPYKKTIETRVDNTLVDSLRDSGQKLDSMTQENDFKLAELEYQQLLLKD